jgi:hypothetical protein
MKRTKGFFTDEQIKRLTEVAKRKGITIAQLIRMYVSVGLDREQSSNTV